MSTLTNLKNSENKTYQLYQLYRLFECFCLQLLLSKVRGPTKFSDLRIVNGQEQATYRKACKLLGVLGKDNHWDPTLEKVAQFRSQASIREWFATLISKCGLSNPTEMWKK